MPSNHCIACGFHVTHSIYNPEDQPLAALYLPKSEAEAKALKRYPLDFRACANCGHIFNAKFKYDDVPYSDNSNLMYNQGSGWQKYMEWMAGHITKSYDVAGKTFIDIGCGDGGFFKIFLDMGIKGRFVGFEPGIEHENAAKNGLESYKDYFIAERDLPKFKPDFLFCRHVIEHLEEPRDFISGIAYWANLHGVFPLFIAEVPRIDKAVTNARINDYLYEHVSNFTEFSFKNMFETCGYEVMESVSVYDDEVALIVAKPKKIERFAANKASSEKYHARISSQFSSVEKTLGDLLKQGKKVAFWGGTGKGASFLNGFGLKTDQFPVVVDSDYNKVGYFVPGTAQEIRKPEYLNENPVDVIVINTQWRAKDIYAEIQRRGIKFEKVLVMIGDEMREYKGDTI